MSDLIELSEADLDLIAGGAPKAHAHRLGHDGAVTQVNNDVNIQIALALNILSPGATAIAGNSAVLFQGNLVL